MIQISVTRNLNCKHHTWEMLTATNFKHFSWKEKTKFIKATLARSGGFPFLKI